MLYNSQDEKSGYEFTVLKPKAVGYFPVYISQVNAFIIKNSYNFTNHSKWLLKKPIKNVIKAARSSLK